MDSNYQMPKRKSPNQGMTMAQMVKSHLGPTSTGSSSYPEPSVLDTEESQRNWNIAAILNAKNWMGMIKTNVVLPKDGTTEKQVKQAQAARSAEFFRQSAMPWGNQYMPSDPNRLNNPAQSSFVKQRQLNVGSSYGQFYAFMHALSAAFGQLKQGQ
jgi:hypothetical protein